MSDDIDIPAVRQDFQGVNQRQDIKGQDAPHRAAPYPSEASRLETLYAYDILDTPAEKEFDDIVALASAICETPISLISLVDEDRQWFKARKGFSPSQTDLDRSICAHALHEDDFLEIRDTSADSRTATNPLVSIDSNVRFYAGAKLIAPNGLPIGTLCVLSEEPKVLTELQRTALRTLANQVMTQLELRRNLRSQRVLRNEIDHRVKNSLQTVQSLIRMYAARVSDPTALAAFDAVERRLNSIITLHAELHDTDANESVQLATYLPRVIQLLDGTLPDNIAIRHRTDSVYVTWSEATAVAVVVNEFVANTIKHAFPDGRRGQITIETGRDSEDLIAVRCADDGVGKGQSKAQPDRIATLGERIMQASAAKIGGRLVEDAVPPGYRLSLTFAPSQRGFRTVPPPE